MDSRPRQLRCHRARFIGRSQAFWPRTPADELLLFIYEELVLLFRLRCRETSVSGVGLAEYKPNRSAEDFINHVMRPQRCSRPFRKLLNSRFGTRFERLKHSYGTALHHRCRSPLKPSRLARLSHGICNALTSGRLRAISDGREQRCSEDALAAIRGATIFSRLEMARFFCERHQRYRY